MYQFPNGPTSFKQWKKTPSPEPDTTQLQTQEVTSPTKLQPAQSTHGITENTTNLLDEVYKAGQESFFGISQTVKLFAQDYIPSSSSSTAAVKVDSSNTSSTGIPTNNVTPISSTQAAKFSAAGQTITTTHWTPDSASDSCMQKDEKSNCDVVFSLTNRRQHCRKCGNVFCHKHLLCQMKLNEDAEHDPIDGILYSVCRLCFEHREGYMESEGFSRDHTHTFFILRKDSIDTLNKRARSVNDKFNLLVQGTPERSVSSWAPDDFTNFCPTCETKFSTFHRRHHCRLCGLIYCKNCLDFHVVSEKLKFRTCRSCMRLNDRIQIKEREDSSHNELHQKYKELEVARCDLEEAFFNWEKFFTRFECDIAEIYQRRNS